MKVLKQENQLWYAGALGYCNRCGAEVEVEKSDDPKDMFFHKEGKKVRKTAVFACPQQECGADREGMVIIEREL